MKKVALSLLAFALVGSLAFAEDSMAGTTFKNTAELDVNASASWGYDLDTKVHGFSNSLTAAIKLWFLNGTSDKTGAGDVHGYISAADVKLGFDDKAPADQAGPVLSFGDVTAKIIAGDLYVKLYTNTNPGSARNADGDADNGGATTAADDTFYTYSARYGGSKAEWETGSAYGWSAFDGTGIETGYTIPKTLSVVVGVASHGDWTEAKQSGYEASFAANYLGTDKLTLGATYYTGKSTDTLSAVSAEAAYDFTVAAPYTHVNYQLTDGLYNVDVGAKAPLADGLLLDVIALYGVALKDGDPVTSYAVTLDLASGKLAGPLSADVGLRQKDVTKAYAANVVTEIFGKVGFKISDVLSASATVNTYNVAASSDSSLFAKASLEYTGISLTTLGVYWDSSDLGATKAQGDNKNGKVVLTAKVAY